MCRIIVLFFLCNAIVFILCIVYCEFWRAKRPQLGFLFYVCFLLPSFKSNWYTHQVVGLKMSYFRTKTCLTWFRLRFVQDLAKTKKQCALHTDIKDGVIWFSNVCEGHNSENWTFHSWKLLRMEISITILWSKLGTEWFCFILFILKTISVSIFSIEQNTLHDCNFQFSLLCSSFAFWKLIGNKMIHSFCH